MLSSASFQDFRSFVIVHLYIQAYIVLYVIVLYVRVGVPQTNWHLDRELPWGRRPGVFTTVCRLIIKSNVMSEVMFPSLTGTISIVK